MYCYCYHTAVTEKKPKVATTIIHYVALLCLFPFMRSSTGFVNRPAVERECVGMGLTKAARFANSKEYRDVPADTPIDQFPISVTLDRAARAGLLALVPLASPGIVLSPKTADNLVVVYERLDSLDVRFGSDWREVAVSLTQHKMSKHGDVYRNAVDNKLRTGIYRNFVKSGNDRMLNACQGIDLFDAARRAHPLSAFFVYVMPVGPTTALAGIVFKTH